MANCRIIISFAPSKLRQQNANGMNNIVVGIGEALWDILPEGKKIGGAPANFAYHISQFGLASKVVSAVGDDSLGRQITERFSAKGLSQLIDVAPYPTGTVQVEVDEAGIPQYDIKENVAWDNIPYTAALDELAQHTRAVCFGSLAQRNIVSRTTINRFIDAIPRTDNTLVVFDTNLRQNYYDKEVLADSMRRCNILKINDEELEIVSRIFDLRGTDMEQQCRALLQIYNLKAVILTCGVNGSYVVTSATASFQPTPKVDVADTVGAGDSFTAAFIASLLRGKSLTQAHATAVATSAFVCTQHGAMPTLPAELTM